MSPGKRLRHVSSSQLSFDLGSSAGVFKENVMPQDNLFFAVVPDADTAAEIAKRAADLRIRFGAVARLRPHHVFHVSLLSVGMFAGLPEDVVAAAKAAGTRIQAAPFDAVLDRYTGFNGGKSRAGVFLFGEGNEELVSLYRALGAAAVSERLKADASPSFNPHLTFLYGGDAVEETPIARPIRWHVDEFVLVHSRYGATRHEYLARWPLRG